MKAVMRNKLTAKQINKRQDKFLVGNQTAEYEKEVQTSTINYSIK
jgi:hypothetical protein